MAVFENPDTTTIEAEHIEQAIAIIDYYLHECLRLDSYHEIDPGLLAAQKVLDWAKVKGKQHLLLRDIYQYGPSVVRTKAKAIACMAVLVNHGRAVPLKASDLSEGAKGKAWLLI